MQKRTRRLCWQVFCARSWMVLAFVAVVVYRKPPAYAQHQTATLQPDAPPTSSTIPVDFRCDSLRLDQKTHRHRCMGHVIIRRDTTLVCCETFEAIADATGTWQKILCRGDVRVLRAQEALWADQAEFTPQTGNMLLTGRPLLQRQKSLIAAEKVNLSTQEKRAHIIRPRGSVYNFDTEILPEAQIHTWLTTPLGAKCPLPSRPNPGGM